MRPPTRSGQSDLFAAARASLPQSLPAMMRTKLVSLLSALFLETMSNQPQSVAVRKELAHEQQDQA